MSNPKTPKAVKKVNNALGALVEETGALFQPSKAQRALKARFWTLVSNSLSIKNPRTMTTMEIAQTVRDNRIMNWWNVAGFQDWFLNNTEHIEKLEYLFDLALTAAEDVLLSDDPKSASAKVNMVKVIAELARKMPTRGESKDFADDKVARMSKEELQEYLKAHGFQSMAIEHPPLEVRGEEDSTDGN